MEQKNVVGKGNMMLFSSGNAPRKIEEKWSFLLYFAHLIVPLTLRVQDRLHLGNAKENEFFFCISLGLHYL